MPLIFFSLFMALFGTLALAITGADVVGILVGYLLIGTLSLGVGVLAISASDLFAGVHRQVEE